MMKTRKNKELFVIRVILLLLIVANTFMFLSYNNLNRIIQSYTEQMINMEDTITELNLQLEAYSDNYVALWTTVNAYHNKEEDNK